MAYSYRCDSCGELIRNVVTSHECQNCKINLCPSCYGNRSKLCKWCFSELPGELQWKYRLSKYLRYIIPFVVFFIPVPVSLFNLIFFKMGAEIHIFFLGFLYATLIFLVIEISQRIYGSKISKYKHPTLNVKSATTSDIKEETSLTSQNEAMPSIQSPFQAQSAKEDPFQPPFQSQSAKEVPFQPPFQPQNTDSKPSQPENKEASPFHTFSFQSSTEETIKENISTVKIKQNEDPSISKSETSSVETSQAPIPIVNIIEHELKVHDPSFLESEPMNPIIQESTDFKEIAHELIDRSSQIPSNLQENESTVNENPCPLQFKTCIKSDCGFWKEEKCTF